MERLGEIQVRSHMFHCASNDAEGGEDESGRDDDLTIAHDDWTFSANVLWELIGRWPVPRER